MARDGLVEVIDLEKDPVAVDFEWPKVVFLIRVVRVAKVVEHRDRLDDPFDGLWAEGCHAHSQEADIALQPHRLVKPHSLEFIFGMVLAMAVTILAITTWAAPPNPESDSAMPLFPREMFTGLNTGICTKGYASFRDNAKVLEPSLCCSVPSRPASSPGGLATKAETLPPARCGCTRSSMTAFVSSPRR